MRDARRIVMLALAALSGLVPAAAQETPFAPTEADLSAWLESSAASLKTYAEPDKSLLGTRYLGLRRFSKNLPEDVGYEVYETSPVLHHGKKVYRFDDRAVLVTPEGDTVRVFSTGLADASFNGIRSTLHLVVTGKRPADLTVTTTRLGDTIMVRSSSTGAAAPAEAQTIRVNTAGRPVALSGEIQRFIRLRKWKTGDILALWHLDAVNGEISPVVMRALKNDRTEHAGRPLAPVKVETWLAHADAQTGLSLRLSRTTFFDAVGAVTLVVKPDGLTKVPLTETEFKESWEAKFEDAD